MLHGNPSRISPIMNVFNKAFFSSQRHTNFLSTLVVRLNTDGRRYAFLPFNAVQILTHYTVVAVVLEFVKCFRETVLSVAVHNSFIFCRHHFLATACYNYRPWSSIIFQKLLTFQQTKDSKIKRVFQCLRPGCLSSSVCRGYGNCQLVKKKMKDLYSTYIFPNASLPTLNNWNIFWFFMFPVPRCKVQKKKA